MILQFESELEMESYIYDAFMEFGDLIIDGSAPQYLIRQMNLGVYGIADLVSFEFEIYPDHTFLQVCVYELKKEKVTAPAFVQAFRYATAIKDSIELSHPKISLSVKVAVVGTDIDESCFILNHTEASFYKAVFTPNSGVSFEDLSEGWSRSRGEISPVSEILNLAVLTKDQLAQAV